MTKFIKYSVEHCFNCKAQDAQLKQLDVEVAHHVLDLDKTEDIKIANEYDIQTVPTIVKLNDDGSFQSKLTGLTTMKLLKAFLDIE